jgi:GPH family glycoside/pentoside/hexuronide:cation symporter
MTLSTNTANTKKVPFLTKIIYGTGDWGRASFNTLRQIFYAIFLTDVVGLDPRLASIAALISIIWDAINDPIVGTLSDNVQTRWGRRRPFLLIFAVPFALAFMLLWWAPPWQSQVMLMIHVTLAYMVSDTIQTLVTVPYLALTPEIAEDYDERTSLTTFRMLFNLVSSLLAAVLAPSIISMMMNSGATQQQGYLTIAAIFGGMAIIPFFLIFFRVKESDAPLEKQIDVKDILQSFPTLFKNGPFRYATGLYVLNWIAFDLISLMTPYFLLYWVAQGDMLFTVSLFGMNIDLESAVLGPLFITAILTLPLWNWMAMKFSKKTAYITGIVLWIIVQCIVMLVQPGQPYFIIILAIFIGVNASNAHVIPEAMFPDVIDWGELRTNSRQEGMYYGAIHFARKLSSAIATFLALQILGWFGYQTPPEGAVLFQQSESALFIIRIMAGPFIALILVAAIIFAYRYPITRERQKQIRKSLERRKNRKKGKQRVSA